MTNSEYTAAAKNIKNYKAARWDIAIVLIFTVINVISALAMNSDGEYYYFLFSVYTVVQLAAAGRVYQIADSSMGMMYLGVFLGIALLLFAALVLFWFFSKKKQWAMIVLLVLFAADTFFVLSDMIAYKQTSLFVDLLVHGVIVFYCAFGIKAAGNLSKRFPEGLGLTLDRLNELYRLENGIDPVTGQSVVPPAGAPVPGAPVSPASAGSAPSAAPVGYDPITGAPIYGNDKAAQPAETGAPSAAPVGYDPMTGAPIYGNGGAAQPAETGTPSAEQKEGDGPESL